MKSVLFRHSVSLHHYRSHLMASLSILTSSFDVSKTRLTSWAIALCALVLWTPSFGQIEDPVSWEFSLVNSAKEGMHDLVVHASVDPCWHIYSQDNDPNEGPVPTMFEWAFPEQVTLQGDVKECDPIMEYDPNFMMDLKFFEEEVFWRQTLDLSQTLGGDSLKGYVLFMVCDASMCLPPEEIPFALSVTDISSERPDYCPPSQHLCPHAAADHEEGEGEMPEEEEKEEGLLWTFLLGFGLGLAALLTPCVFPMILSLIHI